MGKNPFGFLKDGVLGDVLGGAGDVLGGALGAGGDLLGGVLGAGTDILGQLLGGGDGGGITGMLMYGLMIFVGIELLFKLIDKI